MSPTALHVLLYFLGFSTGGVTFGYWYWAKYRLAEARRKVAEDEKKRFRTMLYVEKRQNAKKKTA